MNVKLVPLAILVLLAFMVSPNFVQANEISSDEIELTTLLHEFMAGASSSDAATHDRFWAEQLIYTSSAGERFGKAAIMDGMQTDNKTTSAENNEPPTVYSAKDVQIQLYGDTAVVAFRLLGQSKSEEASLSQYFNTGTFVKKDGRWQAVAWQATKIP